MSNTYFKNNQRIHKIRDHFTYLFGVHQENQHLLNYIYLDETNYTLSIKTYPRLKGYEQLPFLVDILKLIENVDLAGLKCLKIHLDNQTEPDIKQLYHQRTIRKQLVNGLLNLRKLKIIEENNNAWNPFTFFLFSQIEIESQSQSYTYQSTNKSNKQMITVIQKYQKGILEHSIKLSSAPSVYSPVSKFLYIQNQNLYRKVLSDFKELMNHIYQLSIEQNRFFSEDSNQYDTNTKQMQSNSSQQMKLKKVVCLMECQQNYFLSQVSSASPLFRIWDLESTRICSFDFVFLQTCQGNDLKDESLEENFQNLDQEFQDISITSKLHLTYLMLKKYQLPQLAQLLKHLKFLTIERLLVPTSYFSFFVGQLQQNCVIGELNKLQMLQIYYHTSVHLVDLLRFGSLFPNLRKLILKNMNSNGNCFKVFDSIMNLVGNLTKVNINNKIVFKSNRLTLELNTQSDFQYLEQIAQNICLFKKPIDLKLGIDRFSMNNQESEVQFVKFFKDILKSHSLNQILLKRICESPDLQTTLAKRNSDIRSIIAFNKYLNHAMLFNPKCILYDLFDFS